MILVGSTLRSEAPCALSDSTHSKASAKSGVWSAKPGRRRGPGIWLDDVKENSKTETAAADVILSVFSAAATKLACCAGHTCACGVAARGWCGRRPSKIKLRSPQPRDCFGGVGLFRGRARGGQGGRRNRRGSSVSGCATATGPAEAGPAVSFHFVPFRVVCFLFRFVSFSRFYSCFPLF